MDKLSALIVDDSSDDCMLLERAIRKLSPAAVVTHAATAEAFRRAAEEDDWDVVFCDLVMPDLDIHEALQIVRVHLPQSPLIAISGVVDEEHLVETIKAGAYDILRKDSFSRFDGVLRRAVEEKRVRLEHAAMGDRLEEAETRFRTLVATTPEAVLVHDEKGKILFANDACRSMHRIERDDELIGRNFRDFVEPAHRARLMARFEAVAESGEPALSKKHIRIAVDGTRIPVEGSLSAIRWAGRKALLAIIRDVSDWEQALARLGESEARFRAAFETAPQGIILSDLRGRWIEVNDAFAAMLGYESAALIGAPVQSFLAPDEVEDTFDRFALLVCGRQKTFQTERHFIRKDGTAVPTMVAVSLSRGTMGDPHHFIMQVFDLTSTKAAETERHRLESELRHAQKMKSLGTLSGGIAHEFNNMLMPIVGLVDLALEETDVDSPIRDYLETALGNADRAAGLIEKILEFSRSEEGASGEDPLETTALLPVVSRAADLLRATIPSTISIEVDLDDVGAAAIDVTQIRQIVMNLGVNAMHAIGDDTGRITIALERVTTDEEIRIAGGQLAAGIYAKLSVRDTGCGMDQATADRVFEPFFTTKAVGKGTGMGLAFVHGAASRHGGSIGLWSEPGEGTRFDLFLPLPGEQHDAGNAGAVVGEQAQADAA